jgi:hypothetical protein
MATGSPAIAAPNPAPKESIARASPRVRDSRKLITPEAFESALAGSRRMCTVTPHAGMRI